MTFSCRIITCIFTDMLKYSRTCPTCKRPPHSPKRYGLSRQLVFRDRFNCTAMWSFETGGLSWQWSLKIEFTVFQQWPLAREGNYCTSVTYGLHTVLYKYIRQTFPLALKHYKTVTCQLILYDKIITEYLKDKLIHTSNWQYMYM